MCRLFGLLKREKFCWKLRLFSPDNARLIYFGAFSFQLQWYSSSHIRFIILRCFVTACDTSSLTLLVFFANGTIQPTVTTTVNCIACHRRHEPNAERERRKANHTMRCAIIPWEEKFVNETKSVSVRMASNKKRDELSEIFLHVECRSCWCKWQKPKCWKTKVGFILGGSLL